VTSCMSVDQVFFDANVLVYAHDRSAEEKHARAKEIVSRAWESDLPPKLSIQVLQETHVSLVRKGLAAKTSASLVRNYLAWDVIENREPLFLEALAFQTEFMISFWDANILAAAVASGAQELWSEDFQAGRAYHGVRVINPFA
jgi:predicted nucleic acid-binding protein